MNGLTVLYDEGCPMCSRFSQWLVGEPQLVPVTAVAAGSERARQRFPRLDHAATLREVTVVADTGEVWTGANAWVVCLWATRAHRGTAEWLARPTGLPVARSVAYAAAGLRARLTTTGAGGGYPDDCDGACTPAV